VQGNDLGGWYTKRQVIVMEPLLWSPPERTATRVAGRLFGKSKRVLDAVVGEWELNKLMCQWIADMGYRYSIPTEVWSFLPPEIYDRLQPPVDRICGDYIVSWTRWENVGEAYTALRINQDIVNVYDADVERVEHYWHMRGVRVPVKGIPT
jgi:hypothetical protein